MLLTASSITFAESNPLPQTALDNLKSETGIPQTQLTMTEQNTSFMRSGLESDHKSNQASSEASRFHFTVDQSNTIKVPKLLKFGATVIAQTLAANTNPSSLVSLESFSAAPRIQNQSSAVVIPAVVMPEEGLVNILIK